MAIDDLDKIDLLVTDKEKSLVHLIITAHPDWEEFDEGITSSCSKTRSMPTCTSSKMGSWSEQGLTPRECRS